MSKAKKLLGFKLFSRFPFCTVFLLAVSLITIDWYLLGERRLNPVTSNQGKKLWKTLNETNLHSTEDLGETDVFEDIFNLDSNLEKKKVLLSKPFSKICPSWSLQPTSGDKYGICTPHQPTEESCKFAREIYRIDSSLSKCKTSGFGDVCEMRFNWSGKGKTMFFKCDESICHQGEDAAFTVQSVNIETGQASVETRFASIEDLQKGLPEIVRKNHKLNLNFVFIECKNHQGREVSQLLPFNPHFTIEEQKHYRHKNLINVNIVLLDSTSRAHFYRSLPRTIATFQNWRQNPETVSAKVFDFELFQAVHGHTAENTHALFTGKLFPVEDNGKALSADPGALFGEYKRAGYQTIWQEDLCWEGGWGLMTDLGASSWTDLQEKLRQSFIDHTGITHASCKILNSLGRKNPFDGPKGDQICYNGKFHHSYLLRHTIDTLHAINATPNALPLLSYTALNVGHDHRAIRTQTLDSQLQNYVKALAEDETTLTIILADHGNTYTEYAATVLEGRFEMFHPSLFVIVPNKVVKRLGKKTMLALETNQRRLVTMIDLHHSLMALAEASSDGAVNHVGLFTPISANRTCDDLELRMPNLCVCEGWDIPARNDTLHVPLAEFAIGTLNNHLQEQYEQHNSRNMSEGGRVTLSRRSCQRLVPLGFHNVRERNSLIDGSLITSMDIRVQAGDVVSQKEDVFHVEVLTVQLPSENSLEMSLLSWDRVTLFGKYKTCADDRADLKLCVCSKNATKTRKGRASMRLHYFGQLPVVKVLNTEKCLWLIERPHDKGNARAFEIANFCRALSYRVEFDVFSFNIKFSKKLPFSLEIKPEKILFAFSLGKNFIEMEAELAVTTTVTPL